MQFLKPVDKLGGEMSSTHIRHVLQTRIRTFFYNGVVYLSTFKTYQNKYVHIHNTYSEKISNKNGFLFKFRKILKGPSFYCQKILHHKTQLCCRTS